MSMLITNIQRFSLQDGPGIRTTVFTKGCPARCPWCANPENLSPNVEYYWDAQKCSQHEQSCKYNRNCHALSSDSPMTETDYIQCPIQAVGIYGREYSTDELVKELLKDSVYYGQNGGVTFSGGECLLHTDALIPVWRKLQEKKIHICIESCMFISPMNVKKVLPYIDYYIIDVKILQKETCFQYLNGNLDFYMQNLKQIQNTKKPLVLRFPLVPGYTDSRQNIEAVKELAQNIRPLKLQIFSVHNLAQSKYRSLNRVWNEFQTFDLRELDDIAQFLQTRYTPVEVITL